MLNTVRNKHCINMLQTEKKSLYAHDRDLTSFQVHLLPCF
jgi:hypothetical protein